MNWNTSPSKHYHGPIDRVYVTLREVHDVDEYIDQYLRTRGYTINDDNRRMVGEKLEKFLGRVPYLQHDLNAFLDRGWCT